MGKKGSYLGGSTVIKTNPWLDDGKAPRIGRLGLAGMAAADAESFVPRTYVVTAEERAKRKPSKDEPLKGNKLKKAFTKRKLKSLAKIEARLSDPNCQEKAAAIREKQATKMSSVIIERKVGRRSLLKKLD